MPSIFSNMPLLCLVFGVLGLVILDRLSIRQWAGVSFVLSTIHPGVGIIIFPPLLILRKRAYYRCLTGSGFLTASILTILAVILFSLLLFVPAILLYGALGWEYPNLGPIANLFMAILSLFLVVPLLVFLFLQKTIAGK